MIRLATLALTASLLAAPAFAHDHTGDIHVHAATARATAPGQTAGGAYLTLENKGKAVDALVSATSPAAKTVELHTMSMDGNVMRMREVASIELPVGQTVTMAPGKGYHLMLMGLKAPLKAGDKVPVTLTFRNSGKKDVTLEVSASGQSNGGHAHQH